MQVLPDPREQVRAFFHESLAIYRGSPLLRNFKRRDFEMLLHEASSTQVAQAMGEDEAFYGEILEIWARRGLKIACSPAQFSGLMHSIFVSTLYVADFGAAYESVITLMISALADKLVVSSEARLL